MKKILVLLAAVLSLSAFAADKLVVTPVPTMPIASPAPAKAPVKKVVKHKKAKPAKSVAAPAAVPAK